MVCTLDAKICPDGSAVGRTGPNCEFAQCPNPPPTPTPDPTGRSCTGPSDTSCGAGFECISRCGPPVARDYDPHPGYYCQPKGYVQMCPICLALNTLIDTPRGPVSVQDVQVGMPVWTVDKTGDRTIGVVEKVSKTKVPSTHKVVHLILSDGRELFASPGHLSVAGHKVGELAVGDLYDGATVASANLVPYTEKFTYDILPTGETGFYYANGTLLGSTLR